MKHDTLRAIAHNAATSLASGCSLLIGLYEVDILGAIAEAPQGEIDVDFLQGAVSGGVRVEKKIGKAVALFPAALPGLCEKHGAEISAFRKMTARYWLTTPQGIRFVVSIVDQFGRASETEYYGKDGKRPIVLDAAGRRRKAAKTL